MIMGRDELKNRGTTTKAENELVGRNINGPMQKRERERKEKAKLQWVSKECREKSE